LCIFIRKNEITASLRNGGIELNGCHELLGSLSSTMSRYDIKYTDAYFKSWKHYSYHYCRKGYVCAAYLIVLNHCHLLYLLQYCGSSVANAHLLSIL